ncbi:hypothetical protein LP316_05090 [Thalassotalea sp. LPB0316]|uniref:hypothetical protein n=1 Tax=Thalassotalea sp. LPB0316 TaxID=2769490 RepID=UPI001868AD8E|nr:hypothetical protein [Thalassotalea sp. LPB0316]QOL26677.1 hypothetical protein LP316_05090 [Thalassotalea sp. LPB0316]
MVKVLGKLFAIGASLMWSVSSVAADDLQWHGFVSQGLIQAEDSTYINDDGDISPELTEVGLNFSYQISQRLRLAAQGVYINGGNRYNEGARVDYLMLDWHAYSDENDNTNIYIGQIKNYTYLYSSVRDVPMARPSILLPQGMYFDATRDLSVGGAGAYINHKHDSQYYGSIDFNLSSSRSEISSKQRRIMLGDQANGDLDHEFDLQSSVYWQPYGVSPWRFGMGFLTGEFNYHAGEQDVFSDGKLILQRYTANVNYEGERWQFSGEIMQERFRLEDLYFAGSLLDRFSQGIYGQARYQLTDELTLLGRVERFYGNKDDRNGDDLEAGSGGLVPHYFAFQHTTTLGVSYDFMPNLRLQLENHWVQGTARLTPIIFPDPVNNNKKNWQVWALQLMYWF